MGTKRFGDVGVTTSEKKGKGETSVKCNGLHALGMVEQTTIKVKVGKVR